MRIDYQRQMQKTEKVVREMWPTALTSMSFAIIIFLSQRYSTLGGSLKFCQGSGWFCMRFHFFIKASFIIDTKGLYCVTKGNISFSSLLFCFRRAGFLSVSFTSNSNFSFPENCVANLCPSSAFEI